MAMELLDSDGTAMSGCNVSDRDGSSAKMRRESKYSSRGGNSAARQLTYEDQQSQGNRHFDLSQIEDVKVEDLDDDEGKLLGWWWPTIWHFFYEMLDAYFAYVRRV